ncbi:MAG: YihY/virulence factor BrkB family protein [Motilibacteraceae bacterium]
MLEQLPEELVRPVRRRYRAGLQRIPGPVRRLVGWSRSDESLLNAAALSFYALMSLPPMVLVAFWIVGGVTGESQLTRTARALSTVLPRQIDAASLLTHMTAVATSIGWFSVLAAVWPATWYGAGLSRSLDRITGGGERRFDGIRGRLLGLCLVLALPVGVLAVLLAALVAPGLSGHGRWSYVLGAVGGTLLGLVVLTALLAAVYEVFGTYEVRWQETTSGGGLAALAIAVVSAGFVLYVRLFAAGADYGTKYGGHLLGSVALFALWVYLVHLVVLSGYRFTVNRARRRRGSSSCPASSSAAGSAAASPTSSSAPTSQNWL